MGSAHSVPADFTQPARGITVALLVITSIGIICRILSRRIQRASLGLDDILVYIAFVNEHSLVHAQTNEGFLASKYWPTGYYTNESTEASHRAFSLPALRKSTSEEQLYLKRVTVALGILYAVSLLFTKISVLFLYRRIFTMNTRWFRNVWWFNLLFLFPGWTVLAFTLLGLQVTPQGSKLLTSKLSIIGSPLVGGLNSVSDLLVLSMPVRMVIKLKMPLRERLGILLLLCMGLGATSISIMRAIRFHIKRKNHWNPAYGLYNDVVLTIVDSSTCLICACFTIVKPLIRKAKEVSITSATSLLSLRSANSSRVTGTQYAASDNQSLNRKPSNDPHGIYRVDRFEVEVNNSQFDKKGNNIVLKSYIVGK
ncbi:hypothetical protein GLAREA_12469 [Glarea lozoyensis ATCC 20868]|uniref:Rhodopsin domain-containing protein n=1 Tax=Glarea lozoyensis (strain ATCC 20868 / MF5171) TaxID=1116229 RepID=S3DZG9_GLAL2|nr:uncharacterized protein GLAREA_12469 [Glarea lozoyensis ATCC 20868]EPE31713.1 hypothetical protein GLAREA_12469 [Glarea lozoyensis ATCC 20868]